MYKRKSNGTLGARLAAPPCLLTMALCFALAATVAHADFTLKQLPYWAGWENLGGETQYGPECLSTRSDRIDCFTISAAGEISRRAWDGSVWRNWEPFPGVIAATSAGGIYYQARMECVSWGADHIDCFVRRDDGTLWRRTWDGAYDHGWQNLGGNIASVPDCVATASRRLDCFARTPTGTLARISFNGHYWENWTTYGGNMMEGTKPECVAYIQGRIECLVVTPTYSLQHYSFQGGVWRSYAALPYAGMSSRLWLGYAPRTPVCRTEPGTDRLACFGPTSTFLSDGRLIESFAMWSYDPSVDRWGYTDLGSDYGRSFSTSLTNLVAYDFDCVTRSGGRTDCFELAVRNQTGSLMGATTLLRQYSMSPGFFSGWSNNVLATAPSPLPSTLSCNSWGGDRLDCFAGGKRFNSSPLWHTWLVPAQLLEWKRFAP